MNDQQLTFVAATATMRKAKMFLANIFQPTCDFYAKLMLRYWLESERCVFFLFCLKMRVRFKRNKQEYTHTHNLAQISSQFHRWYSKLFAYSWFPFTTHKLLHFAKNKLCEIELQINVRRWWQPRQWQRPHTLTKPAQTKTHKRCVTFFPLLFCRFSNAQQFGIWKSMTKYEY